MSVDMMNVLGSKPKAVKKAPISVTMHELPEEYAPIIPEGSRFIPKGSRQPAKAEKAGMGYDVCIFDSKWYPIYKMALTQAKRYNATEYSSLKLVENDRYLHNKRYGVMTATYSVEGHIRDMSVFWREFHRIKEDLDKFTVEQEELGKGNGTYNPYNFIDTFVELHKNMYESSKKGFCTNPEILKMNTFKGYNVAVAESPWTRTPVEPVVPRKVSKIPEHALKKPRKRKPKVLEDAI